MEAAGRLGRSGLAALIASSVPLVLGCGGMLAVVLPMYEGECSMMVALSVGTITWFLLGKRRPD